MITVKKSVYIDKPVGEVFTYASDFANTTKWQGGVESVEVKGAGNAVGETFTEVRKFLGRDMRTTLEVTAFEQDSKWAAKVVQGPVPYEVVTTFEPTNGGTTVFAHIDGEPTGFFKIAQGAVQGQLEKSLEEDLQRLKAQVEAS